MDSKKTTRKPKVASKTRSKEEKETKKLFESIAKKLIKDQLLQFQVQMQSLISANMDSVRHDMISIESSLSSRIITLESKLSNLSERCEEITMSTKRAMDLIQEQQSSSSDIMKANLELERSKRTAHLKKLHDKISLIHSEAQDNMNSLRKDQETVSSNLHDAIRVQSKDMSLLQERVDELLIAKFGFIPRSKSERGATQSSGATVIDQISQRMERIERAFEDDGGTNMDSSFANTMGSPTRHSLSYKGTINRMRKLEENMQDMQGRYSRVEQSVVQLKAEAARNQSKPEDGIHPETITRVILDVKDMEKKVKKLAENTGKACRSLSQGLSDVQEATLNLYTWSDQVHDTLNTVSVKVGLPSGLCERAKVQRRRSKSASTQGLSSWDI